MAPIPEQAPHCVMTMRGGNQEGAGHVWGGVFTCTVHAPLGTVSKQQVHLTPMIGNKQYNFGLQTTHTIFGKSPRDVQEDWTIKKSPK